MNDWIEVCAIDDIPPLGARRLARAQGLDVALFRTADDQVHALLDCCPHKGGPLSQGLVAGQTVSCPLHNWRIDLASGQAAAPDEGCTPRFALRLQAGRVLLRRSELAAHAISQTRPTAGPTQRACACPTP